MNFLNVALFDENMKLYFTLEKKSLTLGLDPDPHLPGNERGSETLDATNLSDHFFQPLALSLFQPPALSWF
jgi:hypothetical protein